MCEDVEPEDSIVAEPFVARVAPPGWSAKRAAAPMDALGGALHDALRRETLVPILGPGLSAASGIAQEDELRGRLSLLCPTIAATSGLGEAALHFKRTKGRTALERMLTEGLDRPSSQPTPAHVLLAQLPFRIFVTASQDLLLERALADAGRSPHAVISDADLGTLPSASVPILKLCGCVSRPPSLVAAQDEYDPLTPLRSALLAVHVADRSVVLLGFRQRDEHLRRVLETLRHCMPRAPHQLYLVTPESPGEPGLGGVQIVQCEPTAWLRALFQDACRAAASIPTSGAHASGVPTGSWPPREEAREPLPSETAVVDDLVAQVIGDLGSDALMAGDIAARAERRTESVLTSRPHFEAVRRMSRRVLDALDAARGPADALKALRSIQRERREVRRAIARTGNRVLERGDGILLFSRSTRALDLLGGAARDLQAACRVYVAECRPRSRLGFEDAIAACEDLAGTQYELTIVPDIMMGTLFEQRQIHKVVLGAHAILERAGRPVSFVNTCGTRWIVRTAAQHDVAVYVVAEREKCAWLDDAAGQAHYRALSEEDVFTPVVETLLQQRAVQPKIACMTLSYEVCDFASNCRLVTA